LAWPVGPLGADLAGALERGRRFHQLLQRHFLGLPVASSPEDESVLAQWWRLFQSHGPRLPAGQRLPEFDLTVPIGRHFLTGRYDLLIAGEDGLFIYDWKTGIRPPSLAALRDDLQTRIYLALAAESATALGTSHAPGEIIPERIRLTYWYASDPPVSRTLAYDGAWHQQNWAYLLDLVDRIERQLATGEDLPLTDDLAHCRRCVYQLFCGRQMAAMDLAAWLDEDSSANDEGSPELEPTRP
jgi:hypothetical protein